MTHSKGFRLTSLFLTALSGMFLTTNLPAQTPNLPWDWSGVIGTGQSLSVGARAFDIKATNQLYGNLQLSTDHLPWPIDPDNTNLVMIPLMEPIGRHSPAYPSSWPENIEAETYHTAMADEISVLVHDAAGHDFIGVHSEVGENGQGMKYIKKGAVHHGLNGRSYEGAMIETKAIERLAKAQGKTFGVGAIVVTHGESDAGNTNYENELHQLWSDYNTDVPAITGQKQGLQMILSQQNVVVDYSPSTQAQWKIGIHYPVSIVCSGPKYQYPYYTDGIHLISDGYEQLGEKYGEVYFHRVILGDDWQPLYPTGIKRDGKTITIQFHVPTPPLDWGTNIQPAHPSIEEWKNGKGFEVCASSGTKVAIKSVEISDDDSIVLTCATDPGPNARVSYAMVAEKDRRTIPSGGTVRWGLLRDSDPFIGAFTKKAQPNFCVAFELTAP